MDRFLDLSSRKEVVENVLEDWLLRELRDELVSKVTWKLPKTSALAAGLRVRLDSKKPLDVYYLTPVGIGGKFFYEHPVGDAFYSAECHVVVEHEEGAIRTKIAEGRLFWVGTSEARGYRISEGFAKLFEDVCDVLRRRFP